MRQLLALPLATLLLALSGCGGGQDRTNSTAATAAATTTSLQSAGVSLDSLVKSLTNFRGATAAADLKSIYKAFASDHDAVSKAVATVTKGAEGTEANARTQLDAWNKQTATIQDPELRAMTAQRSSTLRVATDALATSTGAFKGTSGSFLTQIGDIKKVLDLDLTTGGIAAIKPTISKAITKADELKASFADVAAKVKTISDLLSTK